MNKRWSKVEMDMRKTIKEKKDDNILRLPSCTGKRGNKLLCVFTGLLSLWENDAAHRRKCFYTPDTRSFMISWLLCGRPEVRWKRHGGGNDGVDVLIPWKSGSRERDRRRGLGQDKPVNGTPPVSHCLQPGPTPHSFHCLVIVHSVTNPSMDQSFIPLESEITSQSLLLAIKPMSLLGDAL